MEKKSERKGLGRGLSALMSDVNLAPASETAPRRADSRVAVSSLKPNPLQPRKDFEVDALNALADSIRQKGVIQPLIVRPSGDGYEIVAGERRWRAAQIAQVHEVPVVIRDLDDTEVLEVAIIENIQREDLNAIEEALGLRQLMDRFGHTQEKIAEALSKSRSHVANLLRLLALPETVQVMVREGKLSAGHARALIGAPNAEQLARNIVQRGLSVRETEKLVRDGAKTDERPRETRALSEKDADTRALEADLAAHLGMSVQITLAGRGESGDLTIRFKALDDLDRLCQGLSSVALANKT
jgi:ParB family transcriptional regulator, chromosome partitioning protein